MLLHQARLSEVSCVNAANCLTPSSVMLLHQARLSEVSCGKFPLVATKRSQSSRTTLVSWYVSFRYMWTPKHMLVTFEVSIHCCQQLSAFVLERRIKPTSIRTSSSSVQREGARYSTNFLPLSKYNLLSTLSSFPPSVFKRLKSSLNKSSLLKVSWVTVPFVLAFFVLSFFVSAETKQ